MGERCLGEDRAVRGIGGGTTDPGIDGPARSWCEGTCGCWGDIGRSMDERHRIDPVAMVPRGDDDSFSAPDRGRASYCHNTSRVTRRSLVHPAVTRGSTSAFTDRPMPNPVDE